MARVLIVDDDASLRQALAKHLELAGHRVRQAAHGDDGIRAFQRDAADVVLAPTASSPSHSRSPSCWR